MTDHELVELAAWSIGFEPKRWRETAFREGLVLADRGTGELTHTFWNPLDDAAQALELASHWGMTVLCASHAPSIVSASMFLIGHEPRIRWEQHATSEGTKLAATCRAIVSVAAAAELVERSRDRAKAGRRFLSAEKAS